LPKHKPRGSITEGVATGWFKNLSGETSTPLEGGARFYKKAGQSGITEGRAPAQQFSNAASQEKHRFRTRAAPPTRAFLTTTLSWGKHQGLLQLKHNTRGNCSNTLPTRTPLGKKDPRMASPTTSGGDTNFETAHHSLRSPSGGASTQHTSTARRDSRHREYATTPKARNNLEHHREHNRRSQRKAGDANLAT